MSEITRFEEYEKKTGRLILIIAIIFGLLFLFGLLLLSGDDDNYSTDETRPDFVEDQTENMIPDADNDEDIELPGKEEADNHHSGAD